MIHPTSRWPYKEWPPERWAAVADALDAMGLQVVVTGGPEPREAETVATILSLAKTKPVSVAGQISLHEFGHILKHARLFLGIDTFAMHLAAAMQTPSVTLFGPSVAAAWTPWQNRAEVIAGPCTCNPSTYKACGQPFTPCMLSITEANVIEAAQKVLSGTARPGLHGSTT